MCGIPEGDFPSVKSRRDLSRESPQGNSLLLIIKLIINKLEGDVWNPEGIPDCEIPQGFPQGI